jgi:hypothetical protein
MRASKLVQHMKTEAARMSEGLIQKIKSSERCSELFIKVPADEQRRYALEIYRDLTDWLAADADAVVESRYVSLGTHRASQGVPFSQLFWAVCIAREYLWEYMQQECLLEEPVEFWGGVMLLRSLNQFFDRTLYFTLLGYLKAGSDELAAASAGRAQRQPA